MRSSLPGTQVFYQRRSLKLKQTLTHFVDAVSLTGLRDSESRDNSELCSFFLLLFVLLECHAKSQLQSACLCVIQVVFGFKEHSAYHSQIFLELSLLHFASYSLKKELDILNHAVCILCELHFHGNLEFLLSQVKHKLGGLSVSESHGVWYISKLLRCLLFIFDNLLKMVS